MRFINLEQLLQLHVLAIKQFGGSDGLRDLGRVEAAIATQQQEVFNEELYKSINQKAAAVCRGIIADHPFADGNKRTGMLAALTLLSLNGYELNIEPGELEDFAVKIAVDKCDIPEIAQWFMCHSKKK